jgi:hypothetical protein
MAAALLSLPAAAQENAWQGSDNGPRLKIEVLNREQNANDHRVVVKADTENIALTDPLASPSGGYDEGLLQFRIDNGAYFVTGDSRAAFLNLPSGQHTVEVILADTNYKPLGPKVDVQVSIP